MRESYYIDQTGSIPENLIRATSWMLNNAVDTSFLAIGYIGQLIEIMSPILGENNVKEFSIKKEMRIKNIIIKLITKRDINYYANNNPLVGLYPDEDFLNQLDSISDINKMLIVPWSMNEEFIHQWVKTWSSVTLGEQFLEDEPIFIGNNVIINALKSIRIGPKTSRILSEEEKRKCAWAFTLLLKENIEIIPEEVKSHLIRYENWKSTAAHEAYNIAKKVIEGKRVKKGKRPWRPDIIKIWKER